MTNSGRWAALAEPYRSAAREAMHVARLLADRLPSR